MADIELRSYQQILGQMAGALIAETDLTDLSPGSVLLTLLEAAASSDFQSEAKLLRVLNLKNIDKASGIDLESFAYEMGVSPTRIGSSSSKVLLTISDSAFTKISTTIYSGTIAPSAGDTKINVVNAENFSASGTIYLGRGTQTSEAISYTTVTDAGSYWTINLSSPLMKDHLVGEEVVMSQGGDRTIPAGTTAFVPPASGAPSIDFRTLVAKTLLDGEDTITGIEALCTNPGSQGNVGRHKIKEFKGLPWSTAAVSNPDPSSGGKDPETDDELRQRIKDRVHNLGKGTAKALIRAVIGVSDDDEGKKVITAYLREPTVAGDRATLFIDDGTGFSPSFSGVGEEVIVTSAAGTENYLQLQKWSLVKAQSASVATEPFELYGGEKLYVEVDGVSEEVSLNSELFRNPGIVTAQEVSEAINEAFSTIEARAKDGVVYITPTADDPDWVRVGSASSNDANSVIKFPTIKQYTIRLYKNDKLLEKNGSSAIIQSLSPSLWDFAGASYELQLTVDGVESPLTTLDQTVFDTYAAGATVTGATAIDWVKVINAKFAGIQAFSKDDGTFIIQSNRGKVESAQVKASGGDLADVLFGGNIESTGKAADFTINTLLGQIELAERLTEGDELKAGTVNTRGFVLSSVKQNYTISASPSPEMVLIADATASIPAVPSTFNVTLSAPSTAIQRVTGSGTSPFANCKADDWVYLYGLSKEGVFKIKEVDASFSYIDCYAANPVAAASTLCDQVNTKLIVMRSAGYTQRVILPSGVVSPSDIATSIESQTTGITAQVLDTDQIKISTDRFSTSSALVVAAICGSASELGISPTIEDSNDPHVASMESEDLSGIASSRYSIDSIASSPYDTMNTNETLTDQDSNRGFFPYLGASAQLIRQPLSKVDANNMNLRDEAPTTYAPFGKDATLASVSWTEFGQSDNAVFIIDNDAAKKTYDIPMYIDGTIQGPSVPSTIELDIADSTLNSTASNLADALLGSSDRWLDYRFEDYKVWFKARNDVPTSVSNAGMRITSNFYGPIGQKTTFGVDYPTEPLKDAKATYEFDASSDLTKCRLILASGEDYALSLDAGKPIQVENSGSGPYTQKMTFCYPADLSLVQVGDICSITDTAFNSNNRGTYKITAVSSLVDASRGFEFKSETKTGDTSGTAITLTSGLSFTPRIGDKVVVGSTTTYISSVTSSSVFAVSTSLGTQSGVSIVVTRKAITADADPSFVVAVGDKIQFGGTIFTVTAILDTKNFDVDTPFAIASLLTGVVSRITLSVTRTTAATAEAAVYLDSTFGITIYPLATASNTTSSLIEVIASTAGVKDVMTASLSTGSDGSGSMDKSTLDESGDDSITLLNGESYVYSTSATSPSIRLKVALDTSPDIGEKVRLIPTTAKNIANHFSKKQVTGLSVSADVALIDRGRRVQVSSKVAGSDGQVYAVGGRASGNNIFNVRETCQQISSSRGLIEVDRSALELFSPGHTIKLSQKGRAKKSYSGVQPSGSTTIAISAAVTPNRAKLVISDAPFATIYSFTHSSGVTWAVRKIGRNRMRYEVLSGTASIPASLQVNDWVFIGNGADSYAGYTPQMAFSVNNRGWFQVLETDNDKYFDIENSIGVEEFKTIASVTSTNKPFVFAAYHSARVGDQVVIGQDAPVDTKNKGTYTITAVDSTTQIEYENSSFVIMSPTALGSTGVNSVYILDQGYTTYRKVVAFAPKPSDPSGRGLILVTPGTDISLLSEGQQAKVSFPNRLGFGVDPVPGMAGYQYWTGLKQKVQRIVDGYEPDSSTFPGTRAAGVMIEVREPQIYRVTGVALKIKTAQGVSLQSISDTIKSAVVGYVNSLGLGQDVILSEIIRLVQEVGGVEAVVMTSPSPSNERISINANAIARINSSEVTVS